MKVLGFSWEYFAIAGLVILFFKVQPQLEKMPWHFNILHWSFVVLFTLIGVNGFRFLIFFLKDRKEFQSLFSQPDHPFGPPLVMQIEVLVFSATSVFLFFAAMELGKFRKRARSVFVCLAPLCAFFYPIVMATALGINPSIKTLMASLVISGVGIFASFFYFRPPANERFW